MVEPKSGLFNKAGCLDTAATRSRDIQLPGFPFPHPIAIGFRIRELSILHMYASSRPADFDENNIS